MRVGTQLDTNLKGSRSQLRVDQSARRKRSTGQHHFAYALASALNVYCIGFGVGPLNIAWTGSQFVRILTFGHEAFATHVCRREGLTNDEL